MKELLYLQKQLFKNETPQETAVASNPSSKVSPTVANSMPCWYYDKKELRDTPSILDGLPFDTERRYRKEGARFIMTCGTEMGLGHNTMATGVVYFHRFYMFHSFKSFPRYVTACCCLFLAGKVEETPKKCRDIIKTARAHLTDNYFYSFGEDPKEEVMTLERILLQTIKFDLQVEHPYTFLLKYAKCFKGDQQKLQKMVQMAWNFVNDSLSTVVCLQWEPEIIAVALIHLASKLSKFTVVDWIGRQPHHSRWWDMFVSDVTMEIIEDICHQVLDLYQSNQKDQPESQSPPQKPPSRADSPTPSKSLPVSTNVSSPGSKAKSIPAAAASTVTPNTAPHAVTAAASEISNIQTIKSLASSTAAGAAAGGGGAPIPSMATNENIPSHAALAAAYQMYSAPIPPPINPHSVYTPAPAPPPPPHTYGPAATGPPLPPQPPYAGGNWPASSMPPSSHYPPHPTNSHPHSNSGGYYSAQGGYGRQRY